MRRWDCLEQFCPQTRVLPQGPLDGPWGCLHGRLQPKNYFIRVYHLSDEFHPKQTHKFDETCLDT